MRGPALLAALSMVLTAVPAALAVETAAGTPPAVTEAPYSDVPAEAWYAPFAADLKQDGAVSGYEDGTFRPDNAVTVGEALVMVLAAAGFDRREATGEHWSSGNADFALEKGFVTGTAAGNVLRLLPPLILEEADCGALCRALDEVLGE